jgi:hypothetical protein
MHEPVQRGLKSLHRLKLPINKRNIVLAAWQTASRGRHGTREASAMQFEHVPRAIVACD